MNSYSKIDILIVDDRPENLLVIESILESMDCNIVKANSGNEALSLMLDHNFALVLLDVQMPEMDGFEVAELMRSSLRTRFTPIIFVTAISKEQRCIFKGYEVGAVDYLFKPIEPIILQSKVKVFIDLFNQRKLVEEQKAMLEIKIKELSELKEANTELEHLSIRDGLTGISNRRNFNYYMQLCWENCQRTEETLSLIMADIDFFKAYNDNYGHLKGDECLIRVANSIAKSIKRPMDLVARYGGEEFAVILPKTNMEDAQKIAEEISKGIQKLFIPHEHSLVSKSVTLSLGVATMVPQSGFTVENIIDKADKALYSAKVGGRNRIFLHN
jgi:diguanylate cyclase (GGDEF)-like protein